MNIGLVITNPPISEITIKLHKASSHLVCIKAYGEYIKIVGMYSKIIAVLRRFERIK